MDRIIGVLKASKSPLHFASKLSTRSIISAPNCKLHSSFKNRQILSFWIFTRTHFSSHLGTLSRNPTSLLHNLPNFSSISHDFFKWTHFSRSFSSQETSLQKVEQKAKPDEDEVGKTIDEAIKDLTISFWQYFKSLSTAIAFLMALVGLYVWKLEKVDETQNENAIYRELVPKIWTTRYHFQVN